MIGIRSRFPCAATTDPVFPWLFGADRTAGRRRLFVLILFPALVFVSTLTFDFVLDDNSVVLTDPLVAEPLHLGSVLAQPVRILDVVLGFFRPVITLTYRADRLLWSTNPAGYHLSNVLCHMLVAVLVYRVALQTTGSLIASWLAAMLFAVMPVHTEAVAWIQGRVDLVPTALVLCALLALVTAYQAARPVMWALSALGVCAFFAALLAKESVASFPVAWGIWEIAALDRRTWRARLPGVSGRLGALLLAGVLYGGLRAYAMAGSQPFPLSVLSSSQRALGFFAVIGEYGGLMFFSDLPINFFRGLPANPPLGLVVLGTVLTALLAVGLGFSWSRRSPLFPWIAWLPITMTPPLLFVIFAYVRGIAFLTADRYLYLPSVAWCILVGSLLARYLTLSGDAMRLAWRLTAIGALLIGYAGLTLVRIQPWADPVGFLEAVKHQSGLSPWVQTVLNDNLGLAYLERGDLDQARRQFLLAAKLSPREASPRNNLGVLLIREGRPAEAKPWLEAAIRLNPAMTSSYGNLGAAYEALGDLPAARAVFAEGLRVAPNSVWLTQGLARTTARGDASTGRERLP